MAKKSNNGSQSAQILNQVQAKMVLRTGDKDKNVFLPKFAKSQPIQYDPNTGAHISGTALLVFKGCAYSYVTGTDDAGISTRYPRIQFLFLVKGTDGLWHTLAVKLDTKWVEHGRLDLLLANLGCPVAVAESVDASEIAELGTDDFAGARVGDLNGALDATEEKIDFVFTATLTQARSTSGAIFYALDETTLTPHFKEGQHVQLESAKAFSISATDTPEVVED